MYFWQEYARQKPQQPAVILPTNITQQLFTKSGKYARFSVFSQSQINHQNNILTWIELNRLIEEQAQTFRQFGIQQGGGIALIGRYNFKSTLCYLAGLSCGARVLCLNPNFPQQKIDNYCQQMEMDCLIDCSQDNLLDFELIDLKTNSIKQLPEDIINICPLTLTLTSGSSGQAKAVVHTLNSHYTNASGVVELMKIKENSILLLSLPIFHVSGQAIIWRWLHQGACLRFVSENFYQDLCQVTHTSLVPTQLQRFLTYIETYQPQWKIRHILLGGSHIPTELTNQLSKLGICCYSGYGMTEMASTIFAKKSNQNNGVGFLLKERYAKIVDQEIWVKGKCLALGYWQAKNYARITPLVNSEGWYQTKDKAQFIHNELFILGRLDNMFISGGENIQPEEIENIILQQPNVEQVFILPKKDLEFGYRPVAFIKFNQPYSTKLVNQLKHNLLGKLEKFKLPITYISLDLNKFENNGIKISRKQLLSWLEQPKNLI